ncbi:MAG: hypothetical protein WEF53_06140 [Bacteroidota bacterium]
MQNSASVLAPRATSSSYFSVFQGDVKILRESLYRYAETLPPPLTLTLINHYEERIKRAQGLPMLGEYTPFILGDLFNLKPEVFDKITLPWFLMYEYTLLLDDLIDLPRISVQRELALSQVLLSSSFNEFRRILGDDESLWTTIDSYLHQWLVGSLHEVDSGDMREEWYGQEALRQQGRRAAIAKLCAAALVYLDQKRLPTAHEERGLDHFCSGFMLLDDLADVHEDYKEGRQNSLLETTREWFRTTVPETTIPWRHLSIHQLTVGLIYSGSISRSWNAASEEIEKGLACFSDSKSQIVDFFTSLSVSCRDSSRLIDEIVGDLLPSSHELLVTESQEQRSKVIELGSAMLKNSWEKILRQVEDGPKACQ